jgi:hypothetical protein
VLIPDAWIFESKIRRGVTTNPYRKTAGHP